MLRQSVRKNKTSLYSLFFQRQTPCTSQAYTFVEQHLCDHRFHTFEVDIAAGQCARVDQDKCLSDAGLVART